MFAMLKRYMTMFEKIVPVNLRSKMKDHKMPSEVLKALWSSCVNTI